MNTRTLTLQAAGVLGLWLLASCGGSSKSTHSSAPAYGELGGRSYEQFQELGAERMVIMDATVQLRVANSDSANKRLMAIARAHGGYAVSLADERSVFRVRVGAMDSAIAEVSGLGRLKGKWLKGTDVTESYVDQELRLDNARKARERYLELLKQAENVQAALLVEKELERLNGEIEMLEGKQQKLRHLTDMATITVQLDQKDKLGPLGYVFVGLWKGVRWLFVRG